MPSPRTSVSTRSSSIVSIPLPEPCRLIRYQVLPFLLGAGHATSPFIPEVSLPMSSMRWPRLLRLFPMKRRREIFPLSRRLLLSPADFQAITVRQRSRCRPMGSFSSVPTGVTTASRSFRSTAPRDASQLAATRPPEAGLPGISGWTLPAVFCWRPTRIQTRLLFSVLGPGGLLPPGTYSRCRIRSASSSCRLLISLRECRGAGSLCRPAG